MKAKKGQFEIKSVDCDFSIRNWRTKLICSCTNVKKYIEEVLERNTALYIVYFHLLTRNVKNVQVADVWNINFP